MFVHAEHRTNEFRRQAVVRPRTVELTRGSERGAASSSPHYSRRLLLQPPTRRCDKPTAGGLTAQSVNILFQVCLPPSRLRAPVLRGVSAVTSRTLVSNAGYVP